jgi:hypothetical protein
MKRVAKIEIGQRFRSLGLTGKITGSYEVQALFHSSIDRRDYARIVDLSDRSRTTVFALGALVDARNFLPMPSASERRPD